MAVRNLTSQEGMMVLEGLAIIFAVLFVTAMGFIRGGSRAAVQGRGRAG